MEWPAAVHGFSRSARMAPSVRCRPTRGHHPQWSAEQILVVGNKVGATSCAIRHSIDSSFTGSTLSAAIKVRMSGSDNALLIVNSSIGVLIECPFSVPSSSIAFTSEMDSQ
jgi:hypothetical protein